MGEFERFRASSVSWSANMQFGAQASVSVGACAWFFYDYLLNVADEIEFVWKRGQKWTTAAYVLMNGLSISALVVGLLMESGVVCANSPIFIGVWGLFVSVFSDLLLTLRIYYMYDCNKRLLVISLALYSLVIASSLVNDIINLPSQTGATAVTPQGKSCFSQRTLVRSTIAITCLLGFCYQAYLGVLALLKVRQAYTQRKLLRGKGLLMLLIRGNLQYYAFMTLTYGTATISAFRWPVPVVHTNNPGSVGTFYVLSTAVKGVLGHKLFRDMRRMLTPEGRDPTFGTITVPSLNLAAVPGEFGEV